MAYYTKRKKSSYRKVEFPCVVWFTLNEKDGEVWKKTSLILTKEDVQGFVPVNGLDCWSDPYFRYAQKAAIAKAKAQQIEWVAMTGPDWFMNY